MWSRLRVDIIALSAQYMPAFCNAEYAFVYAGLHLYLKLPYSALEASLSIRLQITLEPFLHCNRVSCMVFVVCIFQ